MQYDISSIDASADILSAVLRVYKHSNHVSYTFPAAYTVHTITEKWSQESMDWSNGWSTEGGTFDPQALDTFAYDGEFNGWFEFNVTETIKEKLHDPESSFGFLVHVPGNPSTGVSETNQESYFHSSESKELEFRPHIVVSLDGTSTAVAKLVEQKAKVKIDNKILTIDAQEFSNLEVYTFRGQLLKKYRLSQGKNRISFRDLPQCCLIFSITGNTYKSSFIVQIQ